MFESFQILGSLLLTIVALVGLSIGAGLAIGARRNKRLRQPAIAVLSGFAALFLPVLAMDLFMFREFYLNEELVCACGSGDLAQAKWLLSLGASPDATGPKGMDDALGAASEGGHRELVELLLSKGARTDHRNTWGKTALQRAKEAGHTDIVSLLGESGDSR